MSRELARPLLIVGFSVIAAMAIVGWVVAGTSHNREGAKLVVTVLNDRGENLTIQPCGRFFCNKFRPIDLAAGASHTWRTTDGDVDLHSFVVEAAPRGRILGCLAQHGLNRVGDHVVVRVSDLEKCVT